MFKRKSLTINQLIPDRKPGPLRFPGNSSFNRPKLKKFANSKKSISRTNHFPAHDKQMLLLAPQILLEPQH